MYKSDVLTRWTYDIDTSSAMLRGNQRNDDTESSGRGANRTKYHRLGKSLTDDGIGIGPQVVDSLDGFEVGTVDEIASDNFVSECRRCT